MSFAPRRLLPALFLIGTAVLSGAGCSADSPSAADSGAETTPSPSTSVTTPAADESTAAAPAIDADAPPERIRLKGWWVERFPVPAGTEPQVDGCRAGDFSCQLYFADAADDVEAYFAFYERVLPRAGYRVRTDAYGKVYFSGHGVEGGVLAGRGDVAVVISRDLG